MEKVLKKRAISVLKQLLIDSSMSDREIGKNIGASQPTVSRAKKVLVQKGLIEGFTIIPNFYEIGYELMVLTFVKIKANLASEEKMLKGHKIVEKWMNNQPNVIFSSYCRGLDSDGFMVSLHTSYKDFDHFIQKHNKEIGYLLTEVKSSLVNLDKSQAIKPLHLKYLAEDVMDK